MSIYLLTGRLGAGKSLASVGRIQDAVREGRRIATNLDLNLEHLFKSHARTPNVIRIPDKPVVEDLQACGVGNASYDENKNGLIVLDELGSWLNARAWGDKTRQAVIDWLIHSRKYGWDVIFICQHVSQIDKQVRESLVEYLVTCRRMDRMKVPFVGAIIKTMSGGMLKGQLPRMHFGIVRYGTQPDAIVADRWMYFGNDLFRAYDTRQVFREDYPHGIHSLLTPWHLVGRYEVKVSLWRRLVAGIGAARSAVPRPATGRPMPKAIYTLAPDRRVALVRELIASGAL